MKNILVLLLVPIATLFANKSFASEDDINAFEGLSIHKQKKKDTPSCPSVEVPSTAISSSLSASLSNSEEKAEGSTTPQLTSSLSTPPNDSEESEEDEDVIPPLSPGSFFDKQVAVSKKFLLDQSHKINVANKLNAVRQNYNAKQGKWSSPIVDIGINGMSSRSRISLLRGVSDLKITDLDSKASPLLKSGDDPHWQPDGKNPQWYDKCPASYLVGNIQYHVQNKVLYNRVQDGNITIQRVTHREEKRNYYGSYTNYSYVTPSFEEIFNMINTHQAQRMEISTELRNSMRSGERISSFASNLNAILNDFVFILSGEISRRLHDNNFYQDLPMATVVSTLITAIGNPNISINQLKQVFLRITSGNDREAGVKQLNALVHNGNYPPSKTSIRRSLDILCLENEISSENYSDNDSGPHSHSSGSSGENSEGVGPEPTTSAGKNKGKKIESEKPKPSLKSSRKSTGQAGSTRGEKKKEKAEESDASKHSSEPSGGSSEEEAEPTIRAEKNKGKKVGSEKSKPSSKSSRKSSGQAESTRVEKKKEKAEAEESDTSKHSSGPSEGSSEEVEPEPTIRVEKKKGKK